MKKWYKLCPYCANEIKEQAIKCQFCHEFIEKDTSSTNNAKLTNKKVNDKKKTSENKHSNKTMNQLDTEKDDNRWPKNRWWRLKFFLYSISFNIWTILLIVLLWELWADSWILPVFVIANLAFHIYFLSKRFHDCGVSWWFSLFCIIFSPLILIMYFVKWDKWENKYGPAPQ